MFIDRATHKVFQSDRVILAYPKTRLQRLGVANRCDLHIFVLKDFSRVFVGGSEFGFDGLAREADEVEIEALAERFGLPELQEVMARRKPACGLAIDAG